MKDKKFLRIRNSTAEFLIFTKQNQTQSIEVIYEDDTIWLSQKLMAALFNVEVNTINYHLKEIFKRGELQQKATIRKFRIVQKEGSRAVNRELEFYNSMIAKYCRTPDLYLLQLPKFMRIANLKNTALCRTSFLKTILIRC